MIPRPAGNTCIRSGLTSGMSGVIRLISFITNCLQASNDSLVITDPKPKQLPSALTPFAEPDDPKHFSTLNALIREAIGSIAFRVARSISAKAFLLTYCMYRLVKVTQPSVLDERNSLS